MAAHRFCRIRGLTVPGSFFEVSELQPWGGGVNLNSLATKTATNAVEGGTFAALFDGNLGTRGYWPQSVAQNAGFSVTWDFGVGTEQEVTGFKQGGFDTADRYMTAFTLEWSDDNSAWTAIGSKTGLTYPGNNTLSALYDFSPPGGPFPYYIRSALRGGLYLPSRGF